jgi:hypothetical protein
MVRKSHYGISGASIFGMEGAEGEQEGRNQKKASQKKRPFALRHPVSFAGNKADLDVITFYS